MSITSLSLILPSSILIAAVVDDLKTQKVHNWITVSAMILAVSVSFYLGGLEGLKVSALGGGTAFLLCLPLFLLRAIGGGDVKLLIALGLATDSMTVFWILLYSFFWGALLGLFKAFLSGEGIQLLKNTFYLALLRQHANVKLHKVPYTVALLFAWLTHLSLQGGLSL